VRNKLQFGKILQHVFTDEFSVPQNRHPVAKLVDLIEKVGNKYDREALVPELPHGRKKLLDLRPVKA
jgi:phenylalanyl-tRNA synthetase beta subunit